jgi:UDP-3-O-[3-hydroxymyristoyl] glucosamine N-acyltransferase
MNKVFNSKDLAKFIDGKCSQDDIEIENFSSLKTATQKSVSFFYDRKYLDDLKKTKAAVVILNKKDLDLRDGPYILVNDPYLAFAKASSFFIQTEKKLFYS